MKRILIVVDNIQTQSAILQAFAHPDYEITPACDGPTALELLQTKEIDLVLCSMRLPRMDGYELLTRIKEQFPEVIRIILGSEDDGPSVFKAILNNIAKFRIQEPWNSSKLLEYLDQIFETESVLKSKDLLLMINNMERLPTIETNYQKILSMIEKDMNTGTISAEIEKDFAISTKLLQIANSAFYGLRTSSVKHATVFLGLQNLKSLIYSTTILNTFDSTSRQNQQRVTDLWTHALLTSRLLHYIYDVFLSKKLPESAYSAGLLHNIGSLILLQNPVESYAEIVNTARANSLNLLEMEQKAYHVTHQEAGGYLVSWWELPFPIVESALFHHKPLDSRIVNKEIIAAVHLAQHYAWRLTKRPDVTELCPEVYDILGIPASNFEAAVNWNCWM